MQQTLIAKYQLERSMSNNKRSSSHNIVRQFLMVAMTAFIVGFQVSVSLNLVCNNTNNSGFTTVVTMDDTPLQSSLSSIASNKNHNLAYEQSFGFFDEISNQEWLERQTSARNATFQRYVGHPRRHWEKPNLWYYNNYDPIFSCPNRKRVKGIGDGPKWTCNPSRIKEIAMERKKLQQQLSLHSKPKPNCLLYSIGSNGNYQWEDGMFGELEHDPTLCEIHIFDYSQNYEREVNTQRNIHFHQWGLQGSNEPTRSNGEDVFYTFSEIVDKLGHQNHTIDILKIDCEGCEWTSFQDWIGVYDIRQVLVETHTLPKNKTQGLQYFDSFVQNNYFMFSKEVNPWGGGACLEFSYIKLHPDFYGRMD